MKTRALLVSVMFTVRERSGMMEAAVCVLGLIAEHGTKCPKMQQGKNTTEMTTLTCCNRVC